MQAIVLGVGKRTCRQRLTAFDAHNLAGTCGHRQREIADTAEQVEQPIARLRVEQFQRARHQHPVDLVIDLREIRRLERHGDAELGQRVRQRAIERIERIDRIRALRLQPELDVVMIGESTQLRLILSGNRL